MKDENYAFGDRLVHERARDRWLAALFLPATARPHVLALYAFDAEIARVPSIVSEPMLGEIRFQWWRDVIEGARADEAVANPVAAALLDTIVRFDLDRGALLTLIDARTFDLYDDPMPTLAALEDHARATTAVLFKLAAAIVAPPDLARPERSIAEIGIAVGITELLLTLPHSMRQRRLHVPASLLVEKGTSSAAILAGEGAEPFRAALAVLRSEVRRLLAAAGPIRDAVLLPASLCEFYLRRMERHGYDPATSDVTGPLWRRQWILWRAARGLP